MYDNHEKLPLPEVMYLRVAELTAAEHLADGSFAHVLHDEISEAPAVQTVDAAMTQPTSPVEPAPSVQPISSERREPTVDELSDLAKRLAA